jgi:hypothetical protein
LGIRSPAEARRLVEKLEIHDTPRHGSWLNVAEMELSVLAASAWRTGAQEVSYRSRCLLPWKRMDNSVAVVKLVDQNGLLRGK